MKSNAANRLVLLALIAAVLTLCVTLLPVRPLLAAFLTWIRGTGPLGPILLAVAYIPASVLFVPGLVLTLGAGFVFGVVKGTIAVSAGSTLGAAAAFLIGRTLAHDWIQGKVANNPKFAAIGAAVEREGFKIVFLSRLSPVFPFNLLNYAYGITTVSFRDYVLASWLGMIPGTIMYVYLGSAAQDLASVAAGKVEGGSGQHVFLILGLAATIAVTVLITRTARRALSEAARVPTPETTAEEISHA